jgi:hypothetical protein
MVEEEEECLATGEEVRDWVGLREGDDLKRGVEVEGEDGAKIEEEEPEREVVGLLVAVNSSVEKADLTWAEAVFSGLVFSAVGREKVKDLRVEGTGDAVWMSADFDIDEEPATAEVEGGSDETSELAFDFVGEVKEKVAEEKGVGVDLLRGETGLEGVLSEGVVVEGVGANRAVEMRKEEMR